MLRTDFSMWRLQLLVAVIVVTSVGIFTLEAIPQDPAYHDFADSRRLLGISNFYNVASSAAFFFVGLAGLAALKVGEPQGALRALQPSYAALFVATTLIGIGSAYYHLAPSNATLFWDRVPITFALMAFVCVIVGEHINPRLGRVLPLPLLLLGLATVLYWHLTEQHGRGDLRPYILVQLLPVVLVPLIMLLYRSRLTPTWLTWSPLVAYALAKAFETIDAATYHAIGISGHTLKHVIASLGLLLFGSGCSCSATAAACRQGLTGCRDCAATVTPAAVDAKPPPPKRVVDAALRETQ